MTKVRCNYDMCNWCNDGVCDKGSISMYYGECRSIKVTHDIDSYDDED